MYKAICVAALIGTLAFTGRNPIASLGFTYPVVVAKGKLLNQSIAIPTTTIFTPSETGLYRASVYMTMTQSVSTTSVWQFNLFWTDDAGVESAPVVGVYTNGTPPNASSFSDSFSPAFEAVAGQPVSFQTVGQTNTGEYSLYYTIERIQ
jgi:hypothetical protein